MIEFITRFFSLSLLELSIYDLVILVLFVISLVLTIIFGLIIVSTKVRKLNNDLDTQLSEQITNDKTIINYLDIIMSQLSKSKVDLNTNLAIKENLLKSGTIGQPSEEKKPEPVKDSTSISQSPINEEKNENQVKKLESQALVLVNKHNDDEKTLINKINSQEVSHKKTSEVEEIGTQEKAILNQETIYKNRKSKSQSLANLENEIKTISVEKRKILEKVSDEVNLLNELEEIERKIKSRVEETNEDIKESPSAPLVVPPTNEEKISKEDISKIVKATINQMNENSLSAVEINNIPLANVESKEENNSFYETTDIAYETDDTSENIDINSQNFLYENQPLEVNSHSSYSINNDGFQDREMIDLNESFNEETFEELENNDQINNISRSLPIKRTMQQKSYPFRDIRAQDRGVYKSSGQLPLKRTPLVRDSTLRNPILEKTKKFNIDKKLNIQDNQKVEGNFRETNSRYGAGSNNLRKGLNFAPVSLGFLNNLQNKTSKPEIQLSKGAKYTQDIGDNKNKEEGQEDMYNSNISRNNMNPMNNQRGGMGASPMGMNAQRPMGGMQAGNMNMGGMANRGGMGASPAGMNAQRPMGGGMQSGNMNMGGMANRGGMGASPAGMNAQRPMGGGMQSGNMNMGGMANRGGMGRPSPAGMNAQRPMGGGMQSGNMNMGGMANRGGMGASPAGMNAQRPMGGGMQSGNMNMGGMANRGGMGRPSPAGMNAQRPMGGMQAGNMNMGGMANRGGMGRPSPAGMNAQRPMGGGMQSGNMNSGMANRGGMGRPSPAGMNAQRPMGGGMQSGNMNSGMANRGGMGASPAGMNAQRPMGGGMQQEPKTISIKLTPAPSDSSLRRGRRTAPVNNNEQTPAVNVASASRNTPRRSRRR